MATEPIEVITLNIGPETGLGTGNHDTEWFVSDFDVLVPSKKPSILLKSDDARSLSPSPPTFQSTQQPRASHPHRACCKAYPKGPCTACRTPAPACTCLPNFPLGPTRAAPVKCTNLSSARGCGAGLGMLDELLVFAGGFEGNANLDAIDVYNVSSDTWRHTKVRIRDPCCGFL